MTQAFAAPVSGAAQVEMMLNPRAEFGSQDARDLDLSNGI